jgi:hypothetical protein
MKKKLMFSGVRFFAVLAFGMIFGLLESSMAQAAIFKVDDTVADGDPGSLRDAIKQANAAAGQDTIVLQPGRYILTMGQLEIQQDLLIQGRRANRIFIDGNKNGRVFFITTALNPNIKVKMRGITITGGEVQESSYGTGGGIYNEGDLTINRCTIIKNTVQADSAYGGGISNIGNLTINNSSITNNSTSGWIQSGGGIYNAGILTSRNSSINKNNAKGPAIAADGGGIYSYSWDNNVKTTLIRSKINGNTITANDSFGGGIFSGGSNTTLTLIRSRVTGNRTLAAECAVGGGISSEGYLTIRRSKVTGNSVEGGMEAVGGGIECFDNTTIERSQITGNSVNSNSWYAIGGGISSSDNLTLSYSQVTRNTVKGSTSAEGGGIDSYGNTTIRHSQITGNAVNADWYQAAGSGIYSHGDLTILSSKIIGNIANITGNTADAEESWARGGGIYSYIYENQATFRLIGSKVIRNAASCSTPEEDNGACTEEGGGIWIGNRVSYTERKSIVKRNSPDQVFFE